ncbi:hypothetical protein HMPREF0044_1453 [Gleimia coleocanis DSM 15436]|uniref:NodB homology domain-containing protein n=1 Tax=Gleimia coleocanis DSM 15436 TaxID=525245 RepID=C0W200_9ACTO|nr:hypothetical protein HMPREF0044_1453 [Gleimia coleocanis DSM 15436]
MGRRLFFKTIIVLAGATYGGVKIYKNATPPDYDLSYGQVKSPSFFKKLPLDSRLDEAVIEEALEKAAQIEVHSFNQNLDYVFNHQGKKSTYLTFDLGAHTGFEVDWSLLDFLSEQLIPATVFVSLEVSSNHPDTLDLLNTYPNITLGNGCGFVPRPLATEGQQFNGVAAATSAEQLVKEDIVPNYNKLYELTLFAPRFLRPAIPVFDERATNLVYYLRSIPIGYSVDILHSSSNEVHEVFKTIGARDIVRASLTHGREYSEELKRELLASMGRGILWSRLFAQE